MASLWDEEKNRPLAVARCGRGDAKWEHARCALSPGPSPKPACLFAPNFVMIRRKPADIRKGAMCLLSPMTLIVVVVLGFCLLAGLAIILRSALCDWGAPGKCARCGSGNRPGARYCRRCGAEMRGPT